MLTKKTIAHNLFFQERGLAMGQQNKNWLQKPKIELMLFDTSRSKKKAGYKKITSLLGKLS